MSDIKGVLRSLLNAGARAHQAVADVGGGRLVASVTDADGNVIGLIQPASAARIWPALNSRFPQSLRSARVHNDAGVRGAALRFVEPRIAPRPIASGAYMTAEAEGVPHGASAIIPRLFCRDVAAQIEFCTTVFEAVERVRRPGPDGKAAHAMLTVGPAMLMIDAEWPGLPTRAPAADGSSPVVIYVYVKDVDATVARAVARGATVLVPVATQFWGDRMGWIMDPSGHVWTIATRVEETTEDERRQRWSNALSEER